MILSKNKHFTPREVRELKKLGVRLNLSGYCGKKFLNFASRREEDLEETTASMIGQMREDNLLPPPGPAGPDPLLRHLRSAFQKMKTRDLPSNKNYFAMSLKYFFINLEA